jgi:protein TonB
MKKLLVIFTFALFCSATAFSQVEPSQNVPCAENYPGGQEAMYKFINSKLIYPPVAKRNRMQGECVVGLTINEDGTVSHVKVITNKGGGTGEEAVRLVKMLKFEAIGYKLTTSIPVIFKL